MGWWFGYALMGFPSRSFKLFQAYQKEIRPSQVGHSSSTQREPAGSRIGKGCRLVLFCGHDSHIFSEAFRKDLPVAVHIVLPVLVNALSPGKAAGEGYVFLGFWLRNVLGKRFWYQSLVQGVRIYRETCWTIYELLGSAWQFFQYCLLSCMFVHVFWDDDPFFRPVDRGRNCHELFKTTCHSDIYLKPENHLFFIILPCRRPTFTNIQKRHYTTCNFL